MKLKCSILAVTTTVTFREKRGKLLDLRTPYQQWSTEVATSCCEAVLTLSILPKQLKSDLTTTKSMSWSGHHKALIWIPSKMCGQIWRGVREGGHWQTWLSYTGSVRRNGPEFLQSTVRSLWKIAQNVWPKSCSSKAMLLYAKETDGNFSPQRN